MLKLTILLLLGCVVFMLTTWIFGLLWALLIHAGGFILIMAVGTFVLRDSKESRCISQAKLRQGSGRDGPA